MRKSRAQTAQIINSCTNTVKDILSGRYGIENAITSVGMIREVRRLKMIELSGGQIRSIIHRLRVDGDLPNLVAHRKGYHRTDDTKELDNYLLTLVHRADKIIDVRDAMAEYVKRKKRA